MYYPAAVFLVLGTFIFAIGFHSIDNAWNLHTLNTGTGNNWVDNNLYGDDMSENQMYRQGVFVIFAGFLMAVYSGMKLFSQPKRNKKAQQADEFFKNLN